MGAHSSDGDGGSSRGGGGAAAEGHLIAVGSLVCDNTVCGLVWLRCGLLLLLDVVMRVHAVDTRLKVVERISLPLQPAAVHLPFYTNLAQFDLLVGPYADADAEGANTAGGDPASSFTPSTISSDGLSVYLIGGRTHTSGQSICMTQFDHWDLVPGDPLDKSITKMFLTPS